MAEYALQMQDIVKKYGGVTVLDNVDLSVKKGEIHALLGENGAGKTTLMNILGGVTPLSLGVTPPSIFIREESHQEIVVKSICLD